MGYKIGIGVTTYLRPECLAKCIESIHKHTDMSNVTLHIADDSVERKGVAFRKNECLRALKVCDYIFLFDDDCYPIKDGWIEFFVNGCLNSGDNHFLFLNKTHNHLWNFGYGSASNPRVQIYKDCGGVFMFMTKKVIENVGAFNENFETWGFEHAEYSKRINKAGLNKNTHNIDAYYHLEGTEQYIYSEDYSNPTHKSSITNEEKDLLFKKNFPIFAKGIDKIYLPL